MIISSWYTVTCQVAGERMLLGRYYGTSENPARQDIPTDHTTSRHHTGRINLLGGGSLDVCVSESLDTCAETPCTPSGSTDSCPLCSTERATSGPSST